MRKRNVSRCYTKSQQYQFRRYNELDNNRNFHLYRPKARNPMLSTFSKVCDIQLELVFRWYFFCSAYSHVIRTMIPKQNFFFDKHVWLYYKFSFCFNFTSKSKQRYKRKKRKECSGNKEIHWNLVHWSLVTRSNWIPTFFSSNCKKLTC